MKNRIRIGFRVIPVLAFLILLDTIICAQDLRILIGNREIFIESRQNQGRTYYRLNRIADVFSLGLEEKGNSLVVKGSRGELGLIDGRPLVRSGDEYILLSTAAWKRSSEDWYVPVDFLQKALPGILRINLTLESPDRYRVQGLGENRVRLNSIAYSDRLSLVFTPSIKTDIKVNDHRDYVEVTFEELLVTPFIQSQPSERSMIVSISFNPQIGLGSFRIEKGSQFSHFREERLNDPDRLVLNIYPKPGYRITSVGEIRSRNSDWGVEDSSTDDNDTPVGTIQDTRETGIVVVDPGHGGQDRGVDIRLTEAPEKTLNLQISLALERELTSAGIANRLTRYRDVNLGTEQRSAVANYYEARLFIGIHIGASPSPETRGPVVYTYAPVPLEEEEQSEEDGDQEQERKQAEVEGERLQPWQRGQIRFLPESRRLARRLQASLNRVFESENSINAAPLEVLAPIQAPAVVIELGQLSNLEDRELLSNPDFIDELASLLSDTLSGFVPISPEGTSNP